MNTGRSREQLPASPDKRPVWLSAGKGLAQCPTVKGKLGKAKPNCEYSMESYIKFKTLKSE